MIIDFRFIFNSEQTNNIIIQMEEQKEKTCQIK